MDIREEIMKHNVIGEAAEQITEVGNTTHGVLGSCERKADTISYNAQSKIGRLEEASWLSDEAYEKLERSL